VRRKYKAVASAFGPVSGHRKRARAGTQNEVAQARGDHRRPRRSRADERTTEESPAAFS